MRRMLLVAASAMLPACLLFTSLDDTSGGSDPSEAGAADGANASDSPGSDASGGDATSDGAIVANPDAGLCAEDAAGQVLCTEFSGPTLSEGWTGLAGGVGTLTLDQGSMLAKVPVLGQYEQGKNLFFNIDGAFSSISCSFAFRRETLGEEDISIAEMAVSTNGDDYLFAVYTAATYGRLLRQHFPADGGPGTGDETPTDLAFPLNEWHRVTLELTSTQVRSYVDGQLNATMVHDLTKVALRTTFRLGLPQVDGDNTAPWDLRFDDVRCLRTP